LFRHNLFTTDETFGHFLAETKGYWSLAIFENAQKALKADADFRRLRTQISDIFKDYLRKSA